LHVGHRIVGVADAEARGGAGHQLHQAHRALGRYRPGIVGRFGADHGVQQGGIEPVLSRDAVDVGGEALAVLFLDARSPGPGPRAGITALAAPESRTVYGVGGEAGNGLNGFPAIGRRAHDQFIAGIVGDVAEIAYAVFIHESVNIRLNGIAQRHDRHRYQTGHKPPLHGFLLV